MISATKSQAFLVQLLVGGKRAAAWRGDLQEDQLADPVGMLLEELVQRLEAVEDALGVVEPLDADAPA